MKRSYISSYSRHHVADRKLSIAEIDLEKRRRSVTSNHDEFRGKRKEKSGRALAVGRGFDR